MSLELVYEGGESCFGVSTTTRVFTISTEEIELINPNSRLLKDIDNFLVENPTFVVYIL